MRREQTALITEIKLRLFPCPSDALLINKEMNTIIVCSDDQASLI